MSSPETRDFQNFELTDPVGELANGVIPETAESIRFDLSDQPSSEELGYLVGELGKEKELRNNPQLDIDIDKAADLVDQSGVLKPLNHRSLWTPEITAPPRGATTVMTGGMANWMDRSAEVASRPRSLSYTSEEYDIHIVAGIRMMDGITEITNKNVMEYLAATGRFPEERAYAQQFTIPQINELNPKLNPKLSSYEEDDGDQLASLFTGENEDLFSADKEIIFARTASGGIQLAAQYRKAIRERNGMYDGNEESPQVFVVTDGFPVARTQEELDNPGEFQSPFGALRQTVLTAKLIREMQEELDEAARNRPH